MDEFSLASLSMSPSSHQRSVDIMSPVDSVTSDSLATDLSSPTLTESYEHLASPTDPELTQKRKRGRPRKHPIVPVKPKNGRSRTGCITCRKRKKKCDETRPACLNCQHMNKVCEGFYPPDHWRSGRQRAGRSEESLDAPGDPAEHLTLSRTPPLPKLIHGVENEADRMLLDHFTLNLSQSLCLWDRRKSRFDTMILSMALSDLGLMHAILCLSGFQLASGSVRSQMPDDLRPSVIERRFHHLDRALYLLRNKLANMPKTESAPQQTDDATTATIAMLCMRTVVEGDSRGEHRVHLNAGYQSLAMSEHSSNTEFREFMAGFFAYHRISCSITSSTQRDSSVDEDFQLPNFVPPAAGSYLGVLDGLFVSISKIYNLRDRIRRRHAEGLDPFVDSQSLHNAQVIDVELQEWSGSYQDDASRTFVSQLYRQCTWIYLYRTIYLRGSHDSLVQGVESGLALLRRVQGDDAVHPVLLMPVFLLGCAAFEHRHRPPIDAALDLLETKRGCGNIQHTREIVHELWRMMDVGDEDSWNWETLMDNMGLNILIA